ncbi:hypothetical protein DTO013E5_5717 [Penicillium roqueforti]|uniref:Genomic scaffold, ProqFM164S02 n=1 Tax=Penicillium roqueforti (strain FM164) TaxID=1365484 RepID=W6QU87_PENRF|nr:uncharacterized protein LCP9604111_7941 [Penicillium roqueforti]CDM33092.1 unnamed protein product [Penicillium roqueforti FM164]KAF9242758.1 hypothetical protein LCP9604111_7941 [Penicillium roqueforti]KAI1830536.1 hypothetical protein CBS147337_8602 [Penicillium roqueforti]KAI2674380.1 hypothetical protein CBS147355_6994 [Penicillium roqueforti]KAI2683963.1 hypothetical protein LCP963914a_5793 [Penicillium roqueforti]
MTTLSSEKARLQKVADLMLEIYEELSRMRYIQRAGIRRGPHNLTHLEAAYDELDLDSSIKYLYSILPYIDPLAAGKDSFSRIGEFTDFRDIEQAERSRDPFYGDPSDPNFEDENGPYIQPWVTPLTSLGNHGSVMLYDARRHVIWIIDQESWDTTDPALEGHPTKEPQSLNRNSFEHIPHRNAEAALRDILRSYRSLEWIPGSGENTGLEWDGSILSLREMYLENGWPDAFNGDAFEVAQARSFCVYILQEDTDHRLEGENLVHAEMACLRGKLEDARAEVDDWKTRTQNEEDPEELEELKKMLIVSEGTVAIYQRAVKAAEAGTGSQG